MAELVDASRLDRDGHNAHAGSTPVLATMRILKGVLCKISPRFVRIPKIGETWRMDDKNPYKILDVIVLSVSDNRRYVQYRYRYEDSDYEGELHSLEMDAFIACYKPLT